jgi:hypothetical protein
LWRYTTLRDLDYPAAILTDAYGNFGLLGFLLVAALLGSAVAFADRSISIQSSPARLVAGIYVASRVLMFEQQLGGLLSGLVKTAAVLVMVLYLNPFRSKALTKRTSESVGPGRGAALAESGSEQPQEGGLRRPARPARPRGPI